jgi:hypothetical protein
MPVDRCPRHCRAQHDATRVTVNWTAIVILMGGLLVTAWLLSLQEPAAPLMPVRYFDKYLHV